MKNLRSFLVFAMCFAILTSSIAQSQTYYKIVGTGVFDCYGNTSVIPCPVSSKDAFYGQFQGNNKPSFKNNGNGTVTDNVTGLMWQNNPDLNGNNDGKMEKSDKLTWTQIQAKINSINANKFGGYDDWRIPSIKELYSLINWNGTDPSGLQGNSTAGLNPFIDTTYFPFAYGQTSAGERIIDVQYASSTVYKEPGVAGKPKLFGYNFADGRIKGYDLQMPDGSEKTFSFIAVRGNTLYGKNDFADNSDNTVSDKATGLMWAKDDSKSAMNWQEALAYAQTKNSEKYCGYSDWRLPNAKELQSILDYTRSPGSTNSAAIDPIFNCSSIKNEAGVDDFPWYWTSTTHRGYNGGAYGGASGIYICFGRATGWMMIPNTTYYSLVDVHGAGAQRSSPKSGTYLGDKLGLDQNGDPVYGLGPQGDILRVNNYVRLVRTISTVDGINENQEAPSNFGVEQNFPNPFSNKTSITYSIPTSNNVQLKIFDVLGNEIATLVNQYQQQGTYMISLDAATLSLTSGVYFYRLNCGNFSKTKAMLLSF